MKSKSKLQRILFAGLVSATLLMACKKSETPSSPAGNGKTATVNKTDTVATELLSTATNSTWEANDAIGVYMKQDNGLSQILPGIKCGYVEEESYYSEGY